MATATQRRAYSSRLRQITRNFDRLERDTIRQSIQLLRDVRDRIAGQLAGTEFNEWRIAEQQRAIDDIIATYEGQLRSLSNGAVRRSFGMGEQQAIEPIQAAGISGVFFQPSAAQIETLAQFSAELIDGITAGMRSKINSTIRLNALGGQSTLQAMRDITGVLGIPPRQKDPTKGVAYEAERILRTETNRAYNLASHAQQEQLSQQVPGLQKQWMAKADIRTRFSHLLAHGRVVPVNEPFIVDDEELMYPLDPKGSAKNTINCRCRSVTVIPEIGPIETPLDDEIEQERARRND